MLWINNCIIRWRIYAQPALKFLNLITYCAKSTFKTSTVRLWLNNFLYNFSNVSLISRIAYTYINTATGFRLISVSWHYWKPSTYGNTTFSWKLSNHWPKLGRELFATYTGCVHTESGYLPAQGMFWRQQAVTNNLEALTRLKTSIVVH